MVFVHEDEIKAVEELAERVDYESYNYEGWSKFDLLNPKWFKGEPSLPQVGLLQRQRSQFFTDIDRWKSFRDCLRNHHSFVNVPDNNERHLGDYELTKTIQNVKSTRGFEVWTVLGRRNFFDYQRHRRSSEDLPITVLSKEDCWVQLLQEGDRYVKILGIVNGGRPKSLRRWVSELKQLLVDDCNFGFVYGHAMQFQSNLNYPH
jgi:hypothetical protein